MTLSLDQVRDIDCVASLAPLRFDLPSPHREAVGASAILRRVLGRWCTRAGSVRTDPTIGITTPLTELEGARFEDRDLLRLQIELAAQARAEDFVLSARVTVSVVGGSLRVVGRITLVDGRTYALELASAADASVAVLALGAAA